MTKDSSSGGQKQTKQKMKRFLTLIVAVCAIFAAYAQLPMVTLSHNGELSFFTNLGAFKAAYNAASNGDTIYLSEGDFILDGGSITIMKRLNIVGNGYNTHILGDIEINMVGNENAEMEAPLFDGVRLDVLKFNTSGSRNMGESEIRRSWIRKITYPDYAGTDVLYDNCYIESMSFYNGGSSGNVMIRNSKIGYIESGYEATVVNCNINKAEYFPRSMFSSILNNESSCLTSGKCSIHYSLLRFDHKNTNLTKYDCYLDAESSLLDDKLETTIDLAANGYLGQDGKTVVGIYGGEYPFTENPSVPTVDTDNSSVEYDSTSNKLKVSITVKAD